MQAHIEHQMPKPDDMGGHRRAEVVLRVGGVGRVGVGGEARHALGAALAPVASVARPALPLVGKVPLKRRRHLGQRLVGFGAVDEVDLEAVRVGDADALAAAGVARGLERRPDPGGVGLQLGPRGNVEGHPDEVGGLGLLGDVDERVVAVAAHVEAKVGAVVDNHAEGEQEGLEIYTAQYDQIAWNEEDIGDPTRIYSRLTPMDGEFSTKAKRVLEYNDKMTLILS